MDGLSALVREEMERFDSIHHFPTHSAMVFRLTALVLLALLLCLAAADGVCCVEECDRAAQAAGGGQAPAALAGTCLYCPPGVTLARVAIDVASAPLECLDIGRAPDTSPGVPRPIEHPPRIL